MSQVATEETTQAEIAGVTSATDEELVVLAPDDDQALHELIERYRGYARNKARSYFLAGGDHDDVVQEAMIGLYKAIRDYDPQARATFRSFAELCITRQILTAIKTATRQKHQPLNSYIPLDVPKLDEDGAPVADALAAPSPDDPLRRIVITDEERELRAALRELLSSLEADVLQLYMEGRTYQEIAEHLGRHVKCIDNAVQRIKRKLERHVARRQAALSA